MAAVANGNSPSDPLRAGQPSAVRPTLTSGETKGAGASDELAGKRLIVFGSGYVGGEVARQAMERGMRVTALTRNADTAAALHALGAQVVVADLASDVWHADVPGGAEYVLNAVSSGGGGLEGYKHSYVDGMRSLLSWAIGRGKVGTLVYTSSTSVYPQDGGAIVNESADTTGSSERAELLLSAERLLVEARGAACERFFVLRLAGIYGPGRHQLLEQVRDGEVAGKGDYRLNLVHRDDICAAIWRAFAAPPMVRDEIFNVADDSAATKAEVAAWLAGRMALPVPNFTGKPLSARRTLTPDRIISNAKLKHVLQWTPGFPSFREGYENVLATGGV